MQLAFGTLGWTPETFWRSTAVEFHAALQGAARQFDRRSGGGMTRADYEKLKQKLGVT